jgi:hypothetical protein
MDSFNAKDFSEQIDSLLPPRSEANLAESVNPNYRKDKTGE